MSATVLAAPTITIAPSPEARRLYGVMVARSVAGKLSLKETLRISIERTERRQQDIELARELIREGWAKQLSDGSWLIA